MTPLSLTDAYKEYLERMINQSDDLDVVDMFTVPEDIDMDSPTLQEWATFEWHQIPPPNGGSGFLCSKWAMYIY